jgi:hypothetical protein
MLAVKKLPSKQPAKYQNAPLVVPKHSSAFDIGGLKLIMRQQLSDFMRE